MVTALQRHAPLAGLDLLYIRTVTVGSGVTPDHACLATRSWALPPIGNFTLPRRSLC